ncbi:nucleotide exchange factor GrpE [candidate division LCP-89 bacterium B3_LCP]|uniref:Protein GrpE n=1 Tax=candidate division LCP-89 bacterium B3_LCP TaxID=2012998 RepID=A0A532V1U2_UNCL8|nr:MAG: nucleotide exchange factor GrpE [candidate division LCP-89 bacterium B3_LCP]
MAEDRDKEELQKSNHPDENLVDSEEQFPEESADDEKVTEPVDEVILDEDDERQNLKLELDEYKNLYLRKAAEFENFKKRKQQEFQSLIRSAGEALINDILPVLDDFDRLLASGEEDDETSLLEGAKLIREKLWESLEARGLKPIDAVGHPFDPEYHEALMQQEEDGTEAGIVLQEHQRGYLLGDRVIRHAKVVVSA